MKKNNTYLGIDWGEKRIGLAIGHGETRTAVPLKVCGSIEDVLRVLENEMIDEIVIGEPRSNISDKYQVSEEFSVFLEKLKDESGLPVILANEFLSSKAADALEGTKKNKASRDEIAAMLILQSYLDKR